MKPYIICHMMQSVDGRIACDMVDKISGEEYYSALDALDCNSHIEGRYSLQLHQCGFDEFKPSDPQALGREAFHKASESKGYEISADSRGILLWDKTDTANRLCLVSEDVSTEYLDYLRRHGISYIAAGKGTIDLARAAEILYEEFGVKRLAVVGGGKINGGFLSAGLIDEISVMTAPGIDGRTAQPALFDGIEDNNDFRPATLKFKTVSTFPNGVIWARYEVVHNSKK